MSKSRRQRLPSKGLWIGLAKVGQMSRTGVLGNADRAYTNAIGKADSRASFRKNVKQELATLGLSLIRLENAERLPERLSKYAIDKELEKLTKSVAQTGRVGFGTFHAFDVTESQVIPGTSK